MEIKCKICNKVPKIEIFGEIQSIRFICDDSFSHFGLLSINNFYNNFVVNNCDTKIKEFVSNYKKNVNDINEGSSLYYFIKFQEEFELLINELKVQYQDLIEQFNKILFIKHEYLNKIENNKNAIKEDNIIYLNQNILYKLRELVSFIKERKVIKEEYPKIIKNEEITNEIKQILSPKIRKLDIKEYITDFEFYNYTFNKSSINIKKVKEVIAKNEVGFKLNKKLILLNDKLYPAKILYSYSLGFRNENNYMNFYDVNLQTLFRIIIQEKTYYISHLKDGSFILIGDKIKIINVDIVNKTYKISQIVDVNYEESYLEILEIFYDNRVSIIMCFKEDTIFYLIKDNFKSNKYIKINIDSTPIKAKNLFSFKNNIINITNNRVDLYRIHHFYDKDNNFQMKIENNGSIIIDELLNSGIYYIDDDKFVVSGEHKLFLISLSEKEIISIYEEKCKINNIFSGFRGELYLYLYFECKTFGVNKSFLKQINFDNHGIYEVGYKFIENFSAHNYALIDLDDNIYYIS